MKIDWPLIFFGVPVLCALVSLINGNLQILAVGLLCSILGILTERKTK